MRLNMAPGFGSLVDFHSWALLCSLLSGQWFDISDYCTNGFLICFQDLEKSKDYFKRKVEYVQEQMDKIDSLGLQKSKVLNAVVDVIEMKMAMVQQQAAAGSA